MSLGDQCEEEEEAFGTGGAGLKGWDNRGTMPSPLLAKQL